MLHWAIDDDDDDDENCNGYDDHDDYDDVDNGGRSECVPHWAIAALPSVDIDDDDDENDDDDDEGQIIVFHIGLLHLRYIELPFDLQ